ncbi:hypothetical protein BGX28_010395 [Mortierella sp. GBA30]|nr:hypothetical protein BGX28_010395 [Mortierella sp. GBA30]
MSESRGELIAWVNELLQLNYTKVEQLGTGAAYAQIMDSIYGMSTRSRREEPQALRPRSDLPMSRIKFATKHEYEYLGNYKVLQTCFTQRKIDKAIPTDRLMKCKMQDNLEFLQWIKKFWDRNFPGDHYDAQARRGAANEPLAAANRSTSTPIRRAMNNGGKDTYTLTQSLRKTSIISSGIRILVHLV